MVAARSAAMALNRLIDAGIDARNPRTAGRELPTGVAARGEVVAFTAASLGVLVLSTFFLSPPCRYLWPIVVAAFIAYPYTKRFTWFCHYALGLTDGLAPAAAWVAVTGRVALSPVLLFVAVGLWVGGFDVIYAIFDLDSTATRASTRCPSGSGGDELCSSPPSLTLAQSSLLLDGRRAAWTAACLLRRLSAW